MTIKTATLNGVATIEMARPEKKNALTVAMYQTMADALKAAQADPAVRAVLITGQPGIFSSGNDLEDFMSRLPQAGSEALNSPVFQFMRALSGCTKPVVAAVTGAAIGIGTTMLLHCDLVYVSDEARLAMPFVALGIVPEFASSLIVPRLMGHPRAAEKLLLGDPFTAQDAVDCGIANAVLPAGEVVNHARRMAERFNALPPSAVRETKRLMRRVPADEIQKAIDVEGEIFLARLSSPEAREAVQAFFQKRKPDFSKFS
jgi:enoyl-CoA hydratase/carnithine racemase